MSVKEIVIEEIKATTGVSDLNEDMNLYEDLNLSSLDAFALIGTLEERLNCEINEDVLGDVSTLGDFIQAIQKECGDE